MQVIIEFGSIKKKRKRAKEPFKISVTDLRKKPSFDSNNIRTLLLEKLRKKQQLSFNTQCPKPQDLKCVSNQIILKQAEG